MNLSRYEIAVNRREACRAVYHPGSEVLVTSRIGGVQAVRPGTVRRLHRSGRVTVEIPHGDRVVLTIADRANIKNAEGRLA